MMDIEFSSPRLASCFALCLQGGSVFADFNVDTNGNVYAARVSFDGYGCFECSRDEIGRMSEDDSRQLLDMFARQRIKSEVAGDILLRYFRENQHVIWSDALKDHDLL
jgi:hypothetical protein